MPLAKSLPTNPLATSFSANLPVNQLASQAVGQAANRPVNQSASPFVKPLFGVVQTTFAVAHALPDQAWVECPGLASQPNVHRCKRRGQRDWPNQALLPWYLHGLPEGWGDLHTWLTRPHLLLGRIFGANQQLCEPAHLPVEMQIDWVRFYQKRK